MKFTINTLKMKEMVSRATKGVGNNKLIPLTSLMLIELKNNLLTLVTTDATNYLYIKEEKVAGDDFYVVVDANVIAKLVSKTTSENITFNLRPEVWVLEVKGNGNYRIEVPLDENGQPIKYPNPIESLDLSDNSVIVNKSTVNVILETIKPALALTLENPCYTGYYVGDKVVATDVTKIACMNVKLLDEPKLISSEFLDLVTAVNSEKIAVYVKDDVIVFNTSDCTVYGRIMEGIEDFAIDAISDLVNTEFDSFCSMPKNALLQVLDRLNLFVGTYDKNAIALTFTDEGLEISSKSSSGVEIIDYVASENFKPFTCEIDIQMLTQEVKSIQNDIIELHYGEDNAIKMMDGNITIIVALLEDDDVEE